VEVNFVDVLINAALASLGGLVKRLSEMEKSAAHNVSPGYYIVGAFMSMFVGIVVYFLCKNFDAPQFLTAGLTSIGGYMGVPLLDLLSEIAKKRVEKEAGVEVEKSPKK